MKKTIAIILFFILICAVPQSAADFFVSLQGWKSNLNSHQFTGIFNLPLPSEYTGSGILTEEYAMENFISFSVAAGKIFNIGGIEISAGIYAEMSSIDVTGSGTLSIPNPFSQGGTRQLTVNMDPLTMKKNYIALRLAVRLVNSGFYQNQVGLDIGVLNGSVDLLETVSVTETLESAAFVPVLGSTTTGTKKFSQLAFGFKFDNLLRLHQMVYISLGIGYDMSPEIELSNSREEIILINLNAFKFGAGICLKF